MRALLLAILSVVSNVVLLGASCRADAEFSFDAVTLEQAALERQQMAANETHSFCPAMAEFRKSAIEVEYPSGKLKLPGYLYKPAGDGPFPAILWNHGSEKDPRAQAELANFYSSQGYVFFAPIRRGHARAPGPYIVDLQRKSRSAGKTAAAAQRKDIELHEFFNQDVVAAVAWLRGQKFIDPERIVMSGVSYGGIQTLLSAEKGLGVRAFVPFAPGAMSFANPALRERMVQAVQNARAPIFLLQAKNDFSTGPVELLTPELVKRGSPNRAKLYDTFGTTPEEGHGAFACRSLGATIWGPEVLPFLAAALVADSEGR